MSQEVATAGIKELTWTPDQTKLIMDTLCKNATPDEAKLFFYRAKTMRLDPLKPGQIHFVKYNANSPGTIVVGIEGFRSIAGRSGKHVGTKRGIIRNDKGFAIAGWAEVYRSDWKEPARLEVSLAEYNKGSGPWKSMPESMIQKVAEAGALRMAFPDDLGGVYSQDEMDQAKKDPGIRPEQPEPGDGVQIDEYCCSGNLAKAFPALTRRPISKCDPAILRDAISLIESKSKNSGKPIPAWAVEFISHAEPIVSGWENSQPQNPEALDLEPGSDV